MLIPSRTKYRRVHRLPYEGRSRGNRELHFGDYGLQAKEELFNLRFQQATGNLEKPSRIRELRHTVARYKTVL